MTKRLICKPFHFKLEINLFLLLVSAVVGGAVVGLLCAILCVMFVVYRMRKKDEGSYALVPKTVFISLLFFVNKLVRFFSLQ